MSRGKAGPTVADGLAKLGMAVPKRSKYRNVPTIYAGVRYDSKAEADRAASLDDLMKLGLIKLWIGQPKFRLGVPENIYRGDFLVVDCNGGVRVEDVKGKETAKFHRDKKLWRAYGPCVLEIIRDGRIVEVIVPDRLKGG